MGSRRSSLFIPAIVIVVMIGLRREVGGDWWNYLDTFNYIKLAGFDLAMTRTEPGYAMLNWIAARFGWGIWFPNLICAALFTWGLISFCRIQPNPWLALVVALPYFIIGVGMGYTRQSAALGFVMIALVEYIRGRTPRMVIALALAPLFHSSALVVVLLIAIASVRQGIGTWALVIMLGAFLYVQLSGEIVGLLITFSEHIYIATGAVPRLLMNVVPALIFFGFRHRFATTPAELRLWTVFSLATFGTVALMFVVSSTTVVDRVGIYLIPLQMFVLSRVPVVFGSGRRQNTLPLALIIAYSLSVQVVWLDFGTFSKPWVPYKNYLWDWGPGGKRPARAPTR